MKTRTKRQQWTIRSFTGLCDQLRNQVYADNQVDREYDYEGMAETAIYTDQALERFIRMKFGTITTAQAVAKMIEFLRNPNTIAMAMMARKDQASKKNDLPDPFDPDDPAPM